MFAIRELHPLLLSASVGTGGEVGPRSVGTEAGPRIGDAFYATAPERMMDYPFA